jgi:hypothetical protein
MKNCKLIDNYSKPIFEDRIQCMEIYFKKFIDKFDEL